ncbi:MaoC family dehydratase N-terminal domain-containing protein [Gordonia sp. X0973]|uniref:FAS1-like dehydratase domain-containing protein n=1 Tax=Gordonia sp. X0973 TaxID=2742602 RepID=UPI000F53FD51|nr:MaoC family dehydratase N-terminal domain-containing protein [Gordonia sp. X0973]QKT08805.1 MaoC family dehydratase N-terminal domain-containing protein [Gordonia sp. X0973]
MAAAAWEPHTVTSTEFLDPGPVTALATLFDDGLPAPAVGDPLPPLWHWVALPRWAPSSQLSVDGHPFRGSFLPPVELPRRMFAGGSVTFDGELRVGDEVRREATVESVTEKNGRSGQLVIVVTSTTLFAPDGTPAVVEKQNIIYREAAAAGSASERGQSGSDPAKRPAPDPAAAMTPAGPPIVADGDAQWEFRTDPTLLMRFSAATANAHRIHYDWPYATGVEGYPGLVVHGPLMTLSLAETHRLAGTGRVASLSHRNSAPLFCGQSARLVSTPTDNGTTVELLGPRGADAAAHTTVELTLA